MKKQKGDGRKQARTKGAPSGSQTHRRQGRHRADVTEQIYGIHSAEAALLNPAREILGVWVSRNAMSRLNDAIRSAKVEPVEVLPQELDKMLGPDAVHQGVLVRVASLPTLSLADLPDRGLCVALDQVTDPHNVGAVLRSAAVFGASALIMTERNSPALSGVLAKAASGGLEHVPVILVTNLSRALSNLADRGYQRIGLDGEGDEALGRSITSGADLLVLGAEGKGLRRLTKENCDRLCRIPAQGKIRSLNVSNAAAVALFALRAK